MTTPRDIVRIAERIKGDGGAVTLDAIARIEPKVSAVPELRTAAIGQVLLGIMEHDRVSIEDAALDMIDLHDELAGDIAEVVSMLKHAVSSADFGKDEKRPRFNRFPVRFGQYELRALIGRGRSGEVYRAADTMTGGREVAVKVIAPHIEDRLVGMDLSVEARVASRVSHPNVVRFEHAGVEGGAQFVVYELVEGREIYYALRPPLPPRDAAHLVARIAHGLAAVHAAGALHCDISPANILLGDDGTPKLADLGLAVAKERERRSGPGMAPGHGATGWVSPEQYRGGRADATPQSDVYALTGVLYWLLTGSVPNTIGEDRVIVAFGGRSGELDAVPRDLRRIAERGLALDPEDRHAAAALLAQDLDRWLGHAPIEWQRPGPVKRLRLFARRRPRAALGIAGVAALVLGSVGVAVERDARLHYERKLAEEQRANEQQKTAAFDVLLGGIQRWDEKEIPYRASMYEWVGERIFGTWIWASTELHADLFDERVAIYRRRIAGAPEGSVEWIHWRVALAHALVERGESDEPAEIVREARDHYASRTIDGDPIFGFLDYIGAIAEANGILASDGPVDRLRARAVADRLESLLGARHLSGDQVLIRWTITERLLSLAGADCLNDPRLIERVRPHRERLEQIRELDGPDAHADAYIPVDLEEGLSRAQADQLWDRLLEYIDVMTYGHRDDWARRAELFEELSLARGGTPTDLWAQLETLPNAWSSIESFDLESARVFNPTPHADGVYRMPKLHDLGVVYNRGLAFDYGLDPRPDLYTETLRIVRVGATLRSGSPVTVELGWRWVAERGWLPMRGALYFEDGVFAPPFVF